MALRPMTIIFDADHNLVAAAFEPEPRAGQFNVAIAPGNGQYARTVQAPEEFGRYRSGDELFHLLSRLIVRDANGNVSLRKHKVVHKRHP